MIPYGKQDINQADIDAVVDILQSDFLTQGPAVQLFESKLTEYCDAKYAVAVTSNSHGQDLVMKALGVRGKDVINPTISWHLRKK